MFEHVPHLSALAWVLLGLSAVMVGVSKTALPGANTVSVAVFAAVLPARESTAALLLLLIVGDAFALWSYRKHAHWPTLLRLIPTVAIGLVLGALLLGFGSDAAVKRVIGAVLLMLIAVTLWRRRTHGAGAPLGRFARMGYGALGGFTTMVANAGGPVMSMYLLASNFQVKAFLGTAAWFFAILNITKLPISIGLGLLNLGTFSLALVLVPGVVAGAFLGRWITSRISQRAFEVAIISLTIVGALYLLAG